MRFYELKNNFLKVVRAGKKWSEGGKMGENGGKKPEPEPPLPYYYRPCLTFRGCCTYHSTINL